jgi:hypothetical protein
LKELRRAGARTLAEAADAERRLPHGAAGAAAAPPPLGVDPGWGSEARLARWRGARGVALDITALPGLPALTAKARPRCAARAACERGGAGAGQADPWVR